MEILEGNREKFGTDFAKNKKTLEEISIVRSKGLKNELAGFITKFIKKEIREQEEKLQKEQEIQDQTSSEEAQTIEESDDDSQATHDSTESPQN